MLYFDWDPAKEASNLRKHGIAFEAATAALEDPHRLEEEDQVLDVEQRLRTIGMAANLIVVTVSHLSIPQGIQTTKLRVSSQLGRPREVRGETMTTTVRRAAGTPLSEEALDQLRRLADLPDDQIDFSDIPGRVPGTPLSQRRREAHAPQSDALDKAS